MTLAAVLTYLYFLILRLITVTMNKLQEVDGFSQADTTLLEGLTNTNRSFRQRKVDRPSYSVLKSEIEQFGYSGVGRKYGVSDNAVRKWLKAYKSEKNNSNSGFDEKSLTQIHTQKEKGVNPDSANPLICLAPQHGLEPRTKWLTATCSTD